jgi:hypothetical protein
VYDDAAPEGGGEIGRDRFGGEVLAVQEGPVAAAQASLPPHAGGDEVVERALHAVAAEAAARATWRRVRGSSAWASAPSTRPWPSGQTVAIGPVRPNGGFLPATANAAADSRRRRSGATPPAADLGTISR